MNEGRAMARTHVVITIESEPIADIAASLALIHERLTHRHGDRFRALERRVERVCAGELTEPFLVRQLEPDRLVLTPSGELLDIVADARKLGVI
jgi:hypothetical protein